MCKINTAEKKIYKIHTYKFEKEKKCLFSCLINEFYFFLVFELLLLNLQIYHNSEPISLKWSNERRILRVSNVPKLYTPKIYQSFLI